MLKFGVAFKGETIEIGLIGQINRNKSFVLNENNGIVPKDYLQPEDF